MEFLRTCFDTAKVMSSEAETYGVVKYETCLNMSFIVPFLVKTAKYFDFCSRPKFPATKVRYTISFCLSVHPIAITQ